MWLTEVGRRKEEEEEEEAWAMPLFLSSMFSYAFLAKKKKAQAATQSEPPRVGLSKLFKSGVYPTGQEVEYKDE